MTAGAEFDAEPSRAPATGFLGAAQTVLDHFYGVLVALSAVALGAAGCVLTWESAGRYLFKIPSDWQDELSVFLLVGATFLSAAWIQSRRGHVGIDALRQILPAAAERVRRVVADVVSLAFCGFFSSRCWALLVEAWEEGQTTDSPWGPPLWIPYGMMTVGIALLTVQLLLQTLEHFTPTATR